MSESSTRFSLPLLQAGQAQKELYHNEALALIDLALHAAVEAYALDLPPAVPVPGECWIVGPEPAGDWAGRPGVIAGWTPGGWRFIDPPVGMSVWIKPDALWARRGEAGWIVGEVAASSIVVDGQTVVGAQQPGVANVAGGAIIDAEARTAINAILAALRGHGLIAT
jgi:hypothetical protein